MQIGEPFGLRLRDGITNIWEVRVEGGGSRRVVEVESVNWQTIG